MGANDAETIFGLLNYVVRAISGMIEFGGCFVLSPSRCGYFFIFEKKEIVEPPSYGNCSVHTIYDIYYL